MQRHRGIHLSYANVVATLALFIALGGSAFAVTKLAKNSVKSKQIAKGAVKTADIAAGAVTGTQIRDLTITRADIAGGTVTAAEIADGTLTAAELATGSVGGAEVVDGTITTAELADGSITAAELGNGSVASAKLAGGSVTAAKLAPGAVGTAALAVGAVTSAKLADGAVATDALAAGAVTSAKLSPNSITSSTVGPDALGGEDINESTLAPVPAAADAGALDGRPASSYGFSLMGGTAAELPSTGSANRPVQGSSDATSEAQLRVPAAMTVRNLRAGVQTPLVGAQTRTITLLKAGGATALSCTMTSASPGCSDLADAISFAPGDLIAVRFSATGSPPVDGIQWGVLGTVE